MIFLLGAKVTSIHYHHCYTSSECVVEEICIFWGWVADSPLSERCGKQTWREKGNYAMCGLQKTQIIHILLVYNEQL